MGLGLDVSALLAGMSLLPAFSPQPQPLFALAGFLMFVLILAHSATGWQCFRRGGLFGLGLYGVGLHWIFVVADYVPPNFATAITAINGGVILVLCLYPASAAWALHLFRQRMGPHFLLAFPWVWVLGEWLRSWALTGLPLYQLGHAFIGTPLAGFAPVGGELAVTLVAGSAATGLAAVVLYNGWRRRAVAMAGVAALGVAGWALQQVAWTGQGKTITVRVLHGAPDQQRKFRRYYVMDTLKEYLAHSGAAPKPALVIWPESAVPLDIQQVSPDLLDGVGKLAMQGTSILLGSYMQSGSGNHNAFLLADNPSIHYFKRHLVPFGEYTPEWAAANLKRSLPEVQQGALSPGPDVQPILVAQGAAIAPALCYELLFPNELRQQWEKANLLVFASDLNWFRGTWGIHQLFQLARLRAMESGKPLLSSTSYGVTAIIGPTGGVVRQTSGDKPEKWVEGPVTLMSGETPYTRFGSYPVLSTSLLMLLLLPWVAYRQNYLLHPPKTADSSAVQ